jgi:hypothetical protein
VRGGGWILVCAGLVSGAASAQDLEPRAYSNVPVGLNFAVAGYGYMEGEVATDTALPIDDAELDLNTALLAYARSFDWLGRVGKVDLIAPYSWLSGSAQVVGEPLEREVHGFHDPRLRLTWNFYGAPALSMDEWVRRHEDLVIGASFQVQAPVGRYDEDRVVNLGSHRWTFKPELGVSKAWGRVSLELAAAVTLFQDNRDFVGKTREQEPLYAFQAHAV